MISGLLKDLQFALRRVRRASLFSAAVMLILGLGIGANATTLSIVNAFMWRPVNVPNAEQLITIGMRGKDGIGRNMPVPLIEALARSGAPVDGFCAYGSGIAAIEGNRRSAQAAVMFVTGDCFATFQIQPHLGQLIGKEDAPLQGKGSAVAVLGYAYWQHAFGGDPAVVGKTVRIDTATATVVGVLPRHFSGLNKDMDASIVVPFNSYRVNNGAAYFVGRRRDDATIAQVESQLRTVWASALEQVVPATLTGAERRNWLEAQPQLASGSAGLSVLRNLYGSTFVEIAALTTLLVLLTSINVGGLLCSRMASKISELAIMRSLGATRSRVVRTMFLEAVILALGGAVIGLPLAYAAAPAFTALLPVGNLPWTISLRPDGMMLGAAVATALLVALVITAIPAWLVTRSNSLKSGSDRAVTRATNRAAQTLLVLQVAATLVLVFACSLLVRSLVGLEAVDRGYAANDVLSIRLTSTAGGYTELNQPVYYRQLVDRIAALPRVRSVGMARYFGTVPNERGFYSPVAWSGQEEDMTTAMFEYASPGFFPTVGIPLLSGRDFTWSDAPGSAPVVLVSDSLARSLEPNGDVIGRFLRYGKDAARQKLQIVGVVGNTSFGNSRATDIRAAYFPGIQVGQATLGTLHIKTDDSLATIGAPVREVLASLGHEQVVVMSTIDGLFENWLVGERMGATVGTVVTVLALCIACVGVYALLAYAVARRTRELGIRVAIGATRRDISTLVIREAAILAALGVTLGIPAAVASARVLDSLMFGVTTGDPWMLAASGALLIAVAVIAAAGPAWRAVRLDPIIALRAD